MSKLTEQPRPEDPTCASQYILNASLATKLGLCLRWQKVLPHHGRADDVIRTTGKHQAPVSQSAEMVPT